MSDACQVHGFDSLIEGAEHRHSYALGEGVYQGFLRLFGDYNPLHTDASVAQASGFEGAVMHGAILAGFHSHFIGMRFPGRDSLLLSTDFSYLKPCYLGDQIEVRGRVKHRNESLRVVVIGLEFYCLNRSVRVARAETQVKVRE